MLSLQNDANVLEVEVHHCEDSEVQDVNFPGSCEADKEIQTFGGKRGRIRSFHRKRFGRIPRIVGDDCFTVHRDLFE